MIGIAVVLAAGAVQAQEQPAPTPSPTIDRLAAPPTVPAPTQADEGAQLYWLHCQPCHGDQGQGLTEEWREQYPPEDRNCWNSGCHGKQPYEEGFTLPTAVPPVIGEAALAGFADLGQLYHYLRAAMPYEYPGVLSDDEYLAVSAYLARAHGVWDGTPLTEANAGRYRLRAEAPDPAPAAATPAPDPGRLTALTRSEILFALLAVIGITGAVAIQLWRRLRRPAG